MSVLVDATAAQLSSAQHGVENRICIGCPASSCERAFGQSVAQTFPLRLTRMDAWGLRVSPPFGRDTRGKAYDIRDNLPWTLSRAHVVTLVKRCEAFTRSSLLLFPVALVRTQHAGRSEPHGPGYPGLGSSLAARAIGMLSEVHSRTFDTFLCHRIREERPHAAMLFCWSD